MCNANAVALQERALSIGNSLLSTIKEVAISAKNSGVDVGLVFLPIAITFRRESKNSSMLLFSALDKQQFITGLGRNDKTIRYAIDAAELLSLTMSYEEGEKMTSQKEMISAAKQEATMMLLKGSDEIGMELESMKQMANNAPKREDFFKNVVKNNSGSVPTHGRKM